MMELAFPLTDHQVGSAFSLPSAFQIDYHTHAIIWTFQFLLTVSGNSYTFCIHQPLIPFFFLEVSLFSALWLQELWNCLLVGLFQTGRGILQEHVKEQRVCLCSRSITPPSTSSLSPVIVTLQCYVSLYHTMKCSGICIHISPSSWSSLPAPHSTHLSHQRVPS